MKKTCSHIIKPVLIALLPLLLSLPSAHLPADDFYWDTPVQITDTDSRFPSAVTNGTDSYVFWEEVDTDAERIWLSCQYQDESGTWQTKNRFAGPFPYSGEVPDMYSAAVAPEGTIAVAVLSNPTTVSVFTSIDKGRTFTAQKLPEQDVPVLAPRIYCNHAGKFVLFASLGQNESFFLRYSVSGTGEKWPQFSDFEGCKGLTNPFVPVLVKRMEGDLVVFQAQYISGNRISYQLFGSYSSDGCRSWTAPVMLTDASSLAPGDERPFSNFHNQRPYLYTLGGATYISWERTYYTSENAAIWVARVTEKGLVPGTAEEISSRGNANRAVLFSYKDVLSIVWFDTRRGVESVHMAQKNGILWDETTLSSGSSADLFAFPLVTSAGTHLSFIWQETPAKKKGNPSIYRLEPDTTVAKPSVRPLSFAEGKRSTAEKVRVQVELPQDSSGIAGYSWTWSQNPDELPPKEFMNLPSERVQNVYAAADGIWYFTARVVDYAGNWSDAGSVSYYLDKTPPKAPEILPADTDSNGFLSSNTFSLSWQKDASDDDVEGYTWNLQFISPLDSRAAETARHPMRFSGSDASLYVSELLSTHAADVEKADRPPEKMMGNGTETSYKNRRNGLYLFSVAAIDTVGNIGKPAEAFIVLNKYVPVTYIVNVDISVNMLGETTLDITGGGFTYDGIVSQIYIDSDGKAPYDLTLRRTDGSFRVQSDDRITSVKLGNTLAEGSYHLGLMHPDRGLYMTGRIVRIAANGTVKIEHEYKFEPSWTTVEQTARWNVRAEDILLWSVFVLAAAGFVFAVRGLASTARDTVAARLEAQALITGAVMPSERRKKIAAVKQRGISLRVKLVGFTASLVIVIVLLVSIPLGYNMIRTQERTLSQGLEQRVSVLMESLSSGVRAYMPAQNVLELSYLPAQTAALDEAEYATITGFPAGGTNTSLKYVWATNDANIRNKISTKELNFGVSTIVDDSISGIASRCSELNAAAAKQIGEIASNISELNAEGVNLALKTDRNSVQRRNEISQITIQLTNRLNTVMTDLSTKGSGSEPQFNSGKLDRTNTDYLFYRPVLYRQGTSQEYVRGIVLVRVSTKKLITSVDAARRTIIYTSLIIALVAMLIGAAGSFFVASVIVNPIRKLAAHVAKIGETKNKEKLAGKDIVITSHDEIGRLGETVNEMTHGLVKAALDEKLMMDGKVVQQTFLPLLTSGKGVKETIARLQEDKVECFGYYEGASGVSGDYFDYKKLDSRWYVLIKCDASGHGVPAALIMTVVATLFRKYFESWNFAKNGTRINELVTQINDFIESLGLKGKFATIIICLFDTVSGDVFMCNAGDNIVHIYDNDAKTEKTITLAETPAAGPLPSFMVDMKGGFKVEKVNLKKGDVLFLYTDGIEEATRKFRDSSFAVMKCAEPGLKEGELHGNHKVGQDSEQMEPERVSAVIEAVFARRVYRLEKYHNPVTGEVLEFDFTTCKGTLEDVIIALASVEKVFRMYKEPSVLKTDTVRVDKKIDAFLKEHFNLYSRYCGTVNAVSDESNYLEYTFLKEDEQLDDLTLLAVRRP